MTDSSEIDSPSRQKSTWMRGLYMLLILLLLELARAVLVVITIIQFFWMLAKGGNNKELTRFGRGLGRWYRAAIAFETGETEDKPFPWRGWPSDKPE